MKIFELPHMTNVPLDGRAVLLQPWFNGEEWFFYLDAPPGEFHRVLPGSMDAGIYYARSAASPADLEFHLGTLIAQHLSFEQVADRFYELVQDIHMLCASLEKLELIRRFVQDERGAEFLVETEVEYLFALMRSMYDVIQAMVREITPLLTQGGRWIVQGLPDSFRDMVLKGAPEAGLAASHLEKTYGLPSPLARWYESEGERFQLIRAVRDGITHRGRRPPPIYKTERGFAVATTGHGAWSSLEVWRRHELLPNDLGSVRALAAWLAESLLGTLDRCAEGLARVIHPSRLPAAVSPGNKIFVTNAYIARLGNLVSVISSPWEPALR